MAEIKWKYTEKDGRYHFSHVKQLARSPAHYRHAVEHPREPTRPMFLGSLVDRLVFGGPVAVYRGARRAGKDWESFQSQCPPGTLICTEDEHLLATGAHMALMRDPVSRKLIKEGEHQRVMHWEQDELPFAAGIHGERGGFDVLGSDFLADLKTTTDTHPDRWKSHARRMHYAEQLACYRIGARFNGHDIAPNRCYLIGVEINPPHCVTVLRMTSDVIDEAEKTLRLWTERLKQCEAADEWPGYVQSEVDLDVPAWMGLEGIEED